jgi:hypothetical protein
MGRIRFPEDAAERIAFPLTTPRKREPTRTRTGVEAIKSDD